MSKKIFPDLLPTALLCFLVLLFGNSSFLASDYVCGDANEDGTINIGDAVFILNSIFQDGPLPALGCCAECGPGETQPCYTGPPGTEGVGECQSGTQTCTDGVWGPCEGEILPGVEVCDGLDTDCNGNSDEGMTQPCYTGPPGTENVGQCASGTQTCYGGDWGACVGEVLPDPEVCDGADNDCDGDTDEGLTPPPCANQIGVCAGSVQPCIAGEWLSCSASDYGSDYEPTETTCDGLDNDCDGSYDEMCEGAPRVTDWGCSSGECVVLACETGYADINGVFSDGCEGIAPGYCLIGEIFYTEGTENPSNPCQSCQSSQDNTNWSSQPNGTACAVPHASNSQCHNGECIPGGCDPGWGDCNAVPGDGCEVNTDADENNCGACENSCSSPNSSSLCIGGQCYISSCYPGWADCNGTHGDGCEVNTDSDENNCGACGNSCFLPNASSVCIGGQCYISSCDTGWMDCNGTPGDGCEVNTDNDENNCGSCGYSCPPGQTCVDGTCVP